MTEEIRKPQRSLRTILIVWFLLFSIVPLAFVTGYSVIKYEKAIDSELQVRLRGNGQDVNGLMDELAVSLRSARDRYLENPSLIYHIATADSAPLKAAGTTWLNADQSSSLSFFARSGKLILSIYKDSKGGIRELSSGSGGDVTLSKEKLNRLKDQNDVQFVQATNPKKISLSLTSRVTNASGKLVGYIEQQVEINENYLKRLKDRMGLEFMLMLPSGNMAVATAPEFFSYNQKSLADLAEIGSPNVFDLSVSGEPFRFFMQDVFWGDSPIKMALGASKANARSILRNVNYAFYTVLGAVIFLLTLTIIVISNAVLKPLNELVEATWNIQTYDHPVEIPIKSDTEIGLLTESFNHMSRNIIKARQDLKSKISELERANRELKDTQVKLVHTSKMVSLGQLVAGVAHELNNPIGFIFSNMAHLRDYSNRLIKLAETAESDPQKLKELKEELEIDFIKKDIFKLISSCEDGARRTRDIVLGLRNFSRLDEAKLSQLDVHQALDNTLNLLTGELKNRIQVHREYGELPLVTCYTSQINQVFMNILTNAIQAIEGNGNIWISTSKAKSPKGVPMVSISIQDSGKGMSPETMDKVFDPFFSTKEVGQGTGLGLSITYGIIQNHGGEIQVKSQLGIGTEFVIQIPVEMVRKSETDGDRSAGRT